MQSYSTRSLPPQAKLSFWNDTTSAIFTPLETYPANPHLFDAEVSSARIGRLWLANPVSTPARVERTARHARTTERKFFLHLQLRGNLMVTQDGKEALVQEEDLVLTDSSLPYRLRYDEPCSTLVLIVSAGDLKQHLPSPEEVIGVKLSGKQGFSHTTSVMLRSIWNQAQEEMAPEVGSRIADSLLDVFATAWMAAQGMRTPESAISLSRRIQIKRYIEANLRDPELTARSVAAAFGISPRYLHMLFATEQETVSSFILRRRLEQCVRQFADPLWERRTITEIAFGWGFNNATHFARVFRDHYGTSPRDFRHGAQQRQ